MERGLYIHIPFCKHICNYCDFPKMVSDNEKLIEEYIDKLEKEFISYSKYYSNICSIYIGGGTPNALSNYNLERIFNIINSINHAHVREYTIEINPELLTLDQVLLFKKYNITRVSIGAEALDNNVLSKLGRHHTHDDIIKAIDLLRQNGINNINLDFIYAHPYDSKELLSQTIKEAISLKIPHFSFYTLILEEKTMFKIKGAKMLDDDTVSDLMDLCNEMLKDYHHYEISNYSLEGYESIHNMLYWKSMEYIGIGMGASGYLDGIRYDNPRTIRKYINDFKRDELILDINDKKSEYLILGLRMLDGVSISKYRELFNSDIDKDFDISNILKYGLIEINGDMLKLTYKGYKLGNQVFEVFI